MDPSWFDALPALGVIAINGVGTDKVDLERARRQGVRVATTLGVLTDDVADMAIGLMLAVTRRLAAGDRLVRTGGWPRGRSEERRGGKEVFRTGRSRWEP